MNGTTSTYCDRVVLIVAAFAFARRAPRVHVEALAPREVPHAALLGPHRHVLKAFALAFGARRCLRVARFHRLVISERMTAKAARFRPKAAALALAAHAGGGFAIFRRAPNCIYSGLVGPFRGIKLGENHRTAAWSDAIVARCGLDFAQRLWLWAWHLF